MIGLVLELSQSLSSRKVLRSLFISKWIGLTRISFNLRLWRNSSFRKLFFLEFSLGGEWIIFVVMLFVFLLLWDFDYFYRERDKEYRCLSWLHFIHQLEIRFIAFCAWASWSRIRALFLLIYIRQHDRFDLVWRRWQLRLYQRRIARLKQGPKCGSFVFHQLCVGRGWRSCQQSPQHQPS